MITCFIAFLVATLCLLPGGSQGQGQECADGQVINTTVAICAFEPGELGTTCMTLTGEDLPTPVSAFPILAFPADAQCSLRIVEDSLVAVGTAETCTALVRFCDGGS